MTAASRAGRANTRSRPRGATAADRWALAAWLGSRVLVGYAAVIALGGIVAATGTFERWLRWDATLLVEIARFGYGGDPATEPDPGLPGFLPGLPLLLRAVHLVVPSWAMSGLLVSLVASAVAAVALSRLGDFEGPRGTGPRAVAFLFLSPWAVFLAAGYTEALFLAFALPAWLMARKGRWGWAGILAALAAAVRITGLFLAAALVVMYITHAVRTRRRTRPRGDRRSGRHAVASSVPLSLNRRRSPVRVAAHLGALVLPAVPLALYAAYLYQRAGDPLAWLHAQEAGWGRTFTWPWQALAVTVRSAAGGQFALAFRAELVAAAVGLAVCVVLVVRRRWDELCLVGLQVGALVTSAYYLSVTRSTLLWWPLWLLLGRASLRHRWLLPVYVVVSAPLMAWYVSRFVNGAWAG